MMQCGSCGNLRSESDFSGAQKKKAATTRKCKYCMSHQAEPSQLQPAANTQVSNAAPVTQQITFQAHIPMVPLQVHNDQVNALLQENMALRKEREDLLSKALQLALPADIKKQVAGFEDEISRLRKENEALRQENDHLRCQIAALEKSSAAQQEQITWQQSQISVLMESYRRENKIALRTLFDEAKKMRLDTDPKIANVIGKMKSTVNSAAHVVTKERIKAAVEAVTNKDRATILKIYEKVYPPVEEDDESELDDFFG